MMYRCEYLISSKETDAQFHTANYDKYLDSDITRSISHALSTKICSSSLYSPMP